MTVLRIGSDCFRFFSNEGAEPRRIHMRRDRALAKFRLDPVTLQSAKGFAPRELRQVAELVNEHAELLRKTRDEYFSRR